MDAPADSLMPLVDAARKGRAEAFDRIFDEVMPELRAYVRLNTGQRIRQRESMSDLVQSVCREVFEDLPGFRGEGERQFKKWLFTVALNKIQQKGRFHGARRRTPSLEVRPVAPASCSTTFGNDQVLNAYKSICTPSRHAAAGEEVQRIEKVFDQLSDDHRRVITLSCFLRLSHAEIAAEMGRTESATRMLLARARAELALRLAKHEMGG
ncbi:MAG: sigma-70 family RNA polymerase sigma factor [Myxococcales bacterium]|nr:sigma-70 family RNA polymerase sigma factor [Myxococcales bacterium]